MEDWFLKKQKSLCSDYFLMLHQFLLYRSTSPFIWDICLHLTCFSAGLMHFISILHPKSLHFVCETWNDGDNWTWLGIYAITTIDMHTNKTQGNEFHWNCKGKNYVNRLKFIQPESRREDGWSSLFQRGMISSVDELSAAVEPIADLTSLMFMINFQRRLIFGLMTLRPCEALITVISLWQFMTQE